MEVAVILNAPTLEVEVKEDNVIYVDGGYKYKDEKKNTLAIVGDFDSLGYLPENAHTVPKEKNFTDGELAIRKAKQLGASKVVIYGALGGRIDHILGNIALLEIALNLGLKSEIRDKKEIVTLENGKVKINVGKNKTISLIPFTDKAVVTDSKGLYYPLNDLTLTKGDTVGISNVTTEEEISFTVNSGKVLCIIEE